MPKKRTLPQLITAVLLFMFLTVAASARAVTQETTDYPTFDGFVRDANNYCAGAYTDGVKVIIMRTNGTVPDDLSDCSSRHEHMEGNSITSDEIGYFCFVGPDKSYDLTFETPDGRVTYRWLTDYGRTPGVYDIREFGGVGDGSETDNTQALKSAAAFIGSHAHPANVGGVLVIPNGFFKVMGNPRLGVDLPVTLAPGMTIQGVSGKVNIPSSRIQLQLAGKTVFKIGGCTDKVVLRDVGLYGTPGNSSRALVAEGSYPQSSQDFLFSNLVIQNFDIGIEVLGLDADKQWQFDTVKFDNSRIDAKVTGIHLDTINTDWQISNSVISVGPNGDGLLIDRTGEMDITNMYGGGPSAESGHPAHAFIWFRGYLRNGIINIGTHSTVNIQDSECENTKNSILYDMNNIIYDHFRFPLKLSHNVFGDPISIRANLNLVSLGNTYYSDTVRTVRPESTPVNYPGSTKTQIYSFGDQFLYRTSDNHNCYPFDVGSPSPFPVERDREKCVRDFILDNTGGLQNRVVFRTSQLSDPNLAQCDPNHPENCRDATAYDTLYNKMEGTLQNGGDVLPSADDQFDMGNDDKRWRTVRGVRVVSGDTVLSDRKTGQELYKIHEDPENIYFTDIRTGKTMMRLDRNGNLFVTGRVISNSGTQAGQNRPRRGGHSRSAGRR